jgi:hypothetical protein
MVSAARVQRLQNLSQGKGLDDEFDPRYTFALLFALPIAGVLAQFFYLVKGDLTMAQVRQISRRLHFSDLVTIGWYAIDAFTHLSIELGYLVLALTSTPAKSDTYLGWIWREYGRADSRWAVRDANVISIEFLTVFIGLLCIMQIYGCFFKTAWRHPLQIIICVSELYGGWMTFCPEWVDGSPNLDTSDPILLWIYLVFMNGLWVVIPALLLWDSFARLTDVSDQSKARLDLANLSKSGAPTRKWWQAAAITIILYMVLVPGIIFSAKGVPVEL